MYVLVGGWCFGGCMDGYVGRCVARYMDLSLGGLCLAGYMDGYLGRWVFVVWMYGWMCW